MVTIFKDFKSKLYYHVCFQPNVSEKLKIIISRVWYTTEKLQRYYNTKSCFGPILWRYLTLFMREQRLS